MFILKVYVNIDTESYIRIVILQILQRLIESLIRENLCENDLYVLIQTKLIIIITNCNIEGPMSLICI